MVGLVAKGQLSIDYTEETSFRSPVSYPFYLSGNFGELRETHFHAGIDIKRSYGKSPDKIYAISDGFVSRIMVSPGGYGRALYIDHPDVGYTSVYAHLESFSEDIEKIVLQEQMKNESFAVDFKLIPTDIPVLQSKVIGIMGNAGHSYGKHLHFEIRETKSEKPVNPFLYGFLPKDKTPPTVLSISLHGLDPEFHKINERRLPLGNSSSKITEFNDVIEISAWRIGVAIQAYDKHDGVHNKNGIYSLKMYVDDSLTYNFKLDQLSFENTKNIIGFYDYSVRKKDSKTFLLCYKYPGNPLEFLQNTGSGIVNIYATKDRKIKLEVEDFHKNKKTIQFLVRRSENMESKQPSNDYPYKIEVGQEMQVSERNCIVHFDKNTLFRNIKFNISSQESQNGNIIYHLQDELEPLKKPILVSIKPTILLPEKMEKAVIVYINKKGGRINYGGSWKGGYLTTKIREFGKIQIEYDTVAPSIKPISFVSKANKKSEFKFSIRDNMPTRGDEADDISYKVWIDDVFTVSPLRLMNHTLTIPLDQLSEGNHFLKIEVVDHSKNISYFTSEFSK
jgi:hypothetical protein